LDGRRCAATNPVVVDPNRASEAEPRVIYYFHSERMPVLLLDLYGKNTKDDLSQAERNAMKKRIPILVGHYLGRNKT
jgi:hypothetical protein